MSPILFCKTEKTMGPTPRVWPKDWVMITTVLCCFVTVLLFLYDFVSIFHTFIQSQPHLPFSSRAILASSSQHTHCKYNVCASLTALLTSCWDPFAYHLVPWIPIPSNSEAISVLSFFPSVWKSTHSQQTHWKMNEWIANGWADMRGCLREFTVPLSLGGLFL